MWVCRFGVVWAGCTVAPATGYIGSRNAGRARTVRSGRKEGERKVQGRWEEGQLIQLAVAAVTSSPDVLVPKKPSSPDVIDAGRGPSTRPSPSPSCSPARNICGSEVGPPVHHKAPATPTAKLNFFFG